ncbi:hypothetical protein BC940DRAFT_38344 [Gongronella butleri]|nr:hypothetical protein BC940DRAFT_38344 [Gongronella butleri]
MNVSCKMQNTRTQKKKKKIVANNTFFLPGAEFDYNAKPDKFYIETETVGSLAPEEVVTMAMKTLVEKLHYVQMQIQEEVDTKEQDNAEWNF